MEISPADRGTLNTKDIKRDFRSRACVSPPGDLGCVVKRSKSNFFRNDHVAYQIKGNHECSNMVVNTLPADPLVPPIDRVPVSHSLGT